MAVDSNLINQAVIAKLVNDATLQALLPDGIWYKEAKQGAQKFGVISLASGFDEPQYGGRAYESRLYLIKAVVLGTVAGPAIAAAARIEALLEDQPLSASGYAWMTTHREEPFEDVEIDEVDRSIRWQHRGAYFRVDMSVL